LTKIALDDQVVVITGSSRGLGRGYALELARRGAAVVVNGRTAEHVDRTVAEIAAAGGRVVGSYDSVATAEGAVAIVDRAVSAFGTIDVLVNNAGILRNGYFEDLSAEQIDEVLDANLRSAFHVTQAAWPIMKTKGYGRVIMTSSSSGMFAHQGNANYAASKGGIYGLMKALAFEGQNYGITCNALLPYGQTTMAVENPVPDMQEHFRRYHTQDELDRYMSSPRRDAAMVTHLVVYLASSQCTLTGHAFSVCAGRYARVFVAVADGWLAPDPVNVTPELVRDHLAEICDVSCHTIPMWMYDERAEAVKRSDALDASTKPVSINDDVENPLPTGYDGR
jgi:NAD(P)-dependent dehydrogenase (short-subunit alcohol dehydrogenase family)